MWKILCEGSAVSWKASPVLPQLEVAPESKTADAVFDLLAMMVLALFVCASTGQVSGVMAFNCSAGEVKLFHFVIWFTFTIPGFHVS